MPDTAMSIAASNAVIHLRREYLIIGDPMWLDAWGGRTPDTEASKIFTENGETKVGTTRGRSLRDSVLSLYRSIDYFLPFSPVFRRYILDNSRR